MEYRFFADDTMLFSMVKDPDSANDLNHDLDVINKWAYQLNFYFLVKTMLRTIHKLFPMELLLQKWKNKNI